LDHCWMAACMLVFSHGWLRHPCFVSRICHWLVVGAEHAPDSSASAHGRQVRVGRCALPWLCMNAQSRPCCSSSGAYCSTASAASARSAPSACSCCLLSRFRSCQPAPSLLSPFVSLLVRKPLHAAALLAEPALLLLWHSVSADVRLRAAVNVLLFLQPPALCTLQSVEMACLQPKKVLEVRLAVSSQDSILVGIHCAPLADSLSCNTG